MSTHNIGFYEEISKIITLLSSNIIKYAPYFSYCNILTLPSTEHLKKIRAVSQDYMYLSLEFPTRTDKATEGE